MDFVDISTTPAAVHIDSNRVQPSRKGGRCTTASGEDEMAKTPVGRTHKQLRAFVEDVTAALLAGTCHRTLGFGTFSTCTRRATADRCASTMAMFRPSAELRAYASGGPPPLPSGPHAAVVSLVIEAMKRRDRCRRSAAWANGCRTRDWPEAKTDFSRCLGAQ